jgi:NAD(P)-dependent dehydrogenase (short-subunit alcohol dehydrogenase family)/acyl carrier protein
MAIVNEVPTETALHDGVMEAFVATTRYPPEVLDPQAALEEDLGIDSVKLGEVFAVLRARYDLPERLGLAPERLRTIAGITAALAEFVRPGGSGEAGGNGHGGHGNGNGHAPSVAAPAPPSPGDAAALESAVREVFANVTRYPLEILDPAAALEEDLGIDSVKLGEVFAVLRAKYALPEKLGLPPEELRTIARISSALQRFLTPVAAVASSAPVEVELRGASDGSRPSAASRASAEQEPARKPFAGKVALVSGSGHGLGKDIAGHLAELGARVVVNSFHSRELGLATAGEIQARGGDAFHVWGSVANPDHVEALFAEVEARCGGLDFFVSSASNGMLARLADITAEHWEKAFRTNVVGLHQSAMLAAGLMRRRGGGRIVTLSSPAAHGYVDYFGCMGAVKAAVESLTRSLAVELAPDNIQVNCVSPGPVYGELLDKWPESKRLVAQWEANTPYGRLCEARDVSHFVAYLLSGPVKMFTGSVLVMDGGISSQGW